MDIIFILLSVLLGYVCGFFTVILSRKYNENRKIKRKHSFNNELLPTKLASNATEYKSNREEYAAKDY